MGSLTLPSLALALNPSGLALILEAKSLSPVYPKETIRDTGDQG